ncbi:MAG: LysR family transcriptional regulator [Dongiaceae bacterium]
MDSFAGIEAFARVVETGSFTRAAERLQTAKSSVSETVRGLEERLGVRLLDRTTRRVRPTEAGLVFYSRCRRRRVDAAAARSEAEAMHRGAGGQLRVAVPESFASRHIVPSLPGFLAAHPALAIELAEAVAHARLVEEGFDLAIRVAESPDPNLVVRRIAGCQVVIAAAPSYLAAAGTPRHPSELAAHRCIGFTPLAWRELWRLGEHQVTVRPVLLSNSAESMRAAALAGIGLVAVPDWVVSDALSAGRLTRVLADFPPPPVGIYAVYPSNRMITVKVRAFVDHVARDLKTRGFAP